MSTITYNELRPTTLNHESQTKNTSPMNQQFVVTQRHKILHGAKKIPPQILKYVIFLRKYGEKQFFCGYKIFAESVFLTHLSNEAEISTESTVWVTTNCSLMIDTNSYLTGKPLRLYCKDKQVSFVEGNN